MEYLPIAVAQKDKTNNYKLSSPIGFAYSRKSRTPADMNRNESFRDPGGSVQRTLAGFQAVFNGANSFILIKA